MQSGHFFTTKTNTSTVFQNKTKITTSFETKAKTKTRSIETTTGTFRDQYRSTLVAQDQEKDHHLFISRDVGIIYVSVNIIIIYVAHKIKINC